MTEKKDIPEVKEAPAPPNEAVLDLKVMREAHGLSLDDVFAMTRVSMTTLQALEDGDFDRLPPPVYTRSFIRKYAQAVGIDEKPILACHERHLKRQKPLAEVTEVRKPWPENGHRYRFVFLSLGAVITAGILVYAIFLYNQSGGILAPAPSAEPTSTVQADAAPLSQEATTTFTVPPLQNPAPPPAVPSGKMYHLSIEARELTWVRITEDRNPSYQTLLKPGDKIERMASDYFLLDIGNAGGINLTFQGKNLGSLGKRGQIIHVRLPEKTS